MAEPLRRDDVLVSIARAARQAGAVVFVGNGFNARALCALADHPDNFYMVGSMGLCPTIAAGFSHASGRPAIAIEGDGNALMGLSGYPAAAQAARPPFIHCVLDNLVYETTGGQLTLSAGVDFPLLARAAGYGQVVQVSGREELELALDAALSASSSTFLHIRTVRQDQPRHPRVPYSPPAIAERFRRAGEITTQ